MVVALMRESIPKPQKSRIDQSTTTVTSGHETGDFNLQSN